MTSYAGFINQHIRQAAADQITNPGTKSEKLDMAIIERVIPPVVADDGSVHYSSVMSPSDDSIAICYMVPDRIVPVVFVPGVMGSNLRTSTEPHKPVWLVNGQGGVLWDWGKKGAATRKAKLDPGRTDVYDAGTIPGGTVQTADELRRRGWGEVANMSYGTFLSWLENALNDADTCNSGWRVELMKNLGDLVPGVSALSHEEVALSYRYQFPVHAVGYNWLQSNADSALRLKAKIDGFMDYYRRQGKKCEYVILITHSMGGLVSRWYSENLEGKENILGIVHAVMPATGAATAYKRVKAGTEMPAGIVLGANAAEMTAVFAQAPGPLQLLPSREYGMGWLKIRSGSQAQSLPDTNPYKEIYLSRGQWWSLCGDRLINPGDTEETAADQNWMSYALLINKRVIPFHEGLEGKYHPYTYVFYGDDAAHKTWGNVVWERKIDRVVRWAGAYSKVDELVDGQVIRDNGTGDQSLLQRSGHEPTYTRYVLQPAADNGDGTVPVRSGAAPGGKVRLCVAHADVDHEGAYKKKPQRLFALWAITKIAYRIKETRMAYTE
jgi:Lecithin:cholesterol acyltransferase